MKQNLLISHRPSILPADLSSLSQTGDIIFGQCSQPPPLHSTMKRPQTHNLVSTSNYYFFQLPYCWIMT